METVFQLDDRKRLSDIVAGRIRDYIITHQLQQGDRLPTELEMAQQFGVSRVSIREATKALASSGVDLARVDFHTVPTDRSWMRDSVPTFVVRDVTSHGNSRHFRWTAEGPSGQVTDGDDTLGVLGGRILYHYTYFKHEAARPHTLR